MKTATSILLLLLASPALADEKDLAEVFKRVEKNDWKADPGAEIRARIKEANRKDVEKWKSITSLDAWEKERGRILASLKKRVLGDFEPQKTVKHLVTRTIPGDGFVIENIVYETVPGLVVTANLYRPEPAVKNPPAILIVHSHHNPKTQGELQDMGMLWARAGCLVLVADQLGHGERRQHPFVDTKSYPGSFKVGRQDYYFRYNLGVQLTLAGESLIGWMARDTMRGVDLVLERGADPKRIILMGAVAGGGDPAGVTAALDERIACVVPFNFGGPQPETKYPLPEDAETTFPYHTGGYWESSRNLPYSISDDFPHWAIVASIAPRKLIHAHEFSWDQERDPVWKRYQKIWGWYKAIDALGFAHGTGLLSGKAPEASHCNNIGAVHRRMIYPYLKKWFDIPLPTAEYSKRIPAEMLQCMTKEAEARFKPRSVAELLQAKVAERKPATAEAFWDGVFKSGRTRLPKFVHATEGASGDVQWKRYVFHEVDRASSVWADALHLRSRSKAGKSPPFVIALAQQGMAGFSMNRAKAIDGLLSRGIDVLLVEVQGMGKLGTPGGRGRTSTATSLSATKWMLGRSQAGDQLVDLVTVLEYFLSREEAPRKFALWGESFSKVNDDAANINVPHDADKQPAFAEPSGPLLALLLATEPDVRAIYVQGGLTHYGSLLDSHFFHVPHDALIPGFLSEGDLPDLARPIAPRPLKMEALVDARNQKAGKSSIAAYGPVVETYRGMKAGDAFQLRSEVSTQQQIADWFAGHLLK